MNSQIRKKAVIIGGGGLVGNEFVKLALEADHYSDITALVRKRLNNYHSHYKFRDQIINFDTPRCYKKHLFGEDLVCTLGTTIKKAKSKDNFRLVDYTYPFEFAKHASENGMINLFIITAAGADPNSFIFYSRVKGELEREISKLEFFSINIFRPSLILGKRNEFRPGEELARFIFKPFSFFISKKFLPVQAADIAKAMIKVSKNPQKGIHIYSNKDIIKLASTNE